MKTITTLLILLTCFSFKAQAIVLELNSGIANASLTSASNSSNAISVNNFGIFASLTKGEGAGVLLGWYISSVTNKVEVSGTVDQSLSSSDMGPVLRWQIDKKKMFSISYAYHVLCKGTLTTNGSAEDLTGTSSLIKFAVEPELGDDFFIGVGLNMYSASYSISTVNSTQSSVGYSNSIMYPSISMAYRF